MSPIRTAKIVLTIAKNVVKPMENAPRSERILSIIVIEALNSLAAKAASRGDFHEANHNVMALLAGNSSHQHDSTCTIPHDRAFNQQEIITIAQASIKESNADEPLPGFYL